ncbi:MAG: hypothetical protein LBE56_10290 [Tannerella sp.]|nr:hypothetical protein [Tannerella sp.]
MKNILAICALVLFILSLSDVNAQRTDVAIQRKPSGAYELLVDGQPTFIKCAVWHTGIELVKKNGDNAIRSEYTKERLDEAASTGLMMLVNLPVTAQRDGFDCDDAADVRRQHEKILQIVRNVKDHPSVMMWALGNEPDKIIF